MSGGGDMRFDREPERPHGRAWGTSRGPRRDPPDLSRLALADASTDGWAADHDLSTLPVGPDAQMDLHRSGILLDRPTSNMRMSDVLAAWRAAERDLADADDASPTRERLQVIVRDLRSLYGRLFDQRVGSLDPDAINGGALTVQQRPVAQHRR